MAQWHAVRSAGFRAEAAVTALKRFECPRNPGSGILRCSARSTPWQDLDGVRGLSATTARTPACSCWSTCGHGTCGLRFHVRAVSGRARVGAGRRSVRVRRRAVFVRVCFAADEGRLRESRRPHTALRRHFSEAGMTEQTGDMGMVVCAPCRWTRGAGVDASEPLEPGRGEVAHRTARDRRQLHRHLLPQRPVPLAVDAADSRRRGRGSRRGHRRRSGGLQGGRSGRIPPCRSAPTRTQRVVAAERLVKLPDGHCSSTWPRRSMLNGIDGPQFLLHLVLTRQSGRYRPWVLRGCQAGLGCCSWAVVEGTTARPSIGTAGSPEKCGDGRSQWLFARDQLSERGFRRPRPGYHRRGGAATWFNDSVGQGHLARFARVPEAARQCSSISVSRRE